MGGAPRADQWRVPAVREPVERARACADGRGRCSCTPRARAPQGGRPRRTRARPAPVPGGLAARVASARALPTARRDAAGGPSQNSGGAFHGGVGPATCGPCMCTSACVCLVAGLVWRCRLSGLRASIAGAGSCVPPPAPAMRQPAPRSAQGKVRRGRKWAPKQCGHDLEGFLVLMKTAVRVTTAGRPRPRPRSSPRPRPRAAAPRRPRACCPAAGP